MRVLILIALALLSTFGMARAQGLDRFAVSKIVHLGFIDGQAPFSFKAADGTPSGYAVDLCAEAIKSIAEKVPDVKVVYVETTLTDAFHDIVSGKIDLLCGAITATLARRQLVDFSQPIFITGMSALLRTDSPADIRSIVLGERQISRPRSPMLRAFASHTFGVRAGSTAEATLRRVMQIEGYGATILTYDSHEAGVAALEARQIDVYFADRGLLIGLLERDPAKSALQLADRWFTHEPYAIALARGDSDLRLLVDRSLTRTYMSPVYVDLLRKYFGDLAPMVAKTVLVQSLPE